MARELPAGALRSLLGQNAVSNVLVSKAIGRRASIVPFTVGSQ